MSLGSNREGHGSRAEKQGAQGCRWKPGEADAGLGAAGWSCALGTNARGGGPPKERNFWRQAEERRHSGLSRLPLLPRQEGDALRRAAEGRLQAAAEFIVGRIVED